MERVTRSTIKCLPRNHIRRSHKVMIYTLDAQCIQFLLCTGILYRGYTSDFLGQISIQRTPRILVGTK